MNQCIYGIQHVNGVTSSTPNTTTIVTFPGHHSHTLLIRNTATLGTIQLSFDDGSNFFDIPAGENLGVDLIGCKQLVVKSATASVSYQILNGYIYR